MESLYIKCQVPRVSYDVNTHQRKCFCTKGQLCNCLEIQVFYCGVNPASSGFMTSSIIFDVC